MSRRPAFALALVLAAMPATAVRAADPPPGASTVAAVAQQPRSFGHVLGDVLTQRVLLEREGRALQPGTLPPAARIDLWLERRPARLETDPQGRRWLAIDYQIINAPRTLSAIALPALAIPTTAGPPLQLAAWPISIAPLTPEQPFGQGDLLPLRPDRPVAPLPVEGLQRQLRHALAALAAVLLAWAGWWAWRNRREAQQLPLAQAWRALQRMDDPASPQAWRVLHQALNRTAGRVVHGASLPQLLDQAQHLRPLQPRLEDFYRESTLRFFAADPATAGQPQAAYPLRPLARALRDAEQRQQH